MTPLTYDQKLAKQLLEIRTKGYTFGTYYRRSAKSYCIIAAYFAASLWASVALWECWPLFWFLLGFLLAVVARDIGWVRATRRNWPFTVSVLDWDEVQRIADEGASAD